jgi:hypothetical protein
MTSKIAYIAPVFGKYIYVFSFGHFAFFALLLMVLLPVRIIAQEIPEYDEISIFLDIPKVGGLDIPVVIKKDEVYLPITDLFNFLKIKIFPSAGLDSISGFFINPQAIFLIDRVHNIINYQGIVYNLNPGDIIRTESNLYLKSSYFGKVFGLDCVFNFRTLTVTLNTMLELPLIREMRQEQMRLNLTRLKGEQKADTTIGRSYPIFRFGMADWSAIASEEINGKSETRLNLSLGSMIAGGEATASLNYNSMEPFTERQQYYLWRYVDNDFKPLRQVVAGKISTHATSSIYNPVIGVQLSNTPTTFRRSFGSYTLSDRTEPGWTVELYVNNVLVDYVKADASGFFTFEVPLVYGTTLVRLKFFGLWGEERTREQSINIPFQFLPENTLEYTVSAGIVEDTSKSKFLRANVNYGISRSLTIGGGVEYLSAVAEAPFMPYLNASLSLFKNLLISGEYTYGVRATGTLNYRLPSNMQFDLKYTRYDKDQKAINYNYIEERKAVLSIPLRIRNFSCYQRFSLYQIVLPASKYTTGEWLYSGSLFGVNTNLTTYAIFIGETKPNVYSNLSLLFRIPGGFVVTPQVQYQYTGNEFLSTKLRLEKKLFKHGFINMSYEQNFINDSRMFELGIRYDFSFAQTGLSARTSNKKTSLVQYARGSLIYDKMTRYIGSDNRPNVGKGGICIIPYLDLNNNGIKDPGEPKAYGLNLHANGGRIEKSERDTTIRILGLESYTNCFIEFDPNSFENIAWRLLTKTMSVAVDPNILKHIEIPITIAGEASGTVSLDENGEERGLGRIIICFYDSNSNPAGKTISEENGYVSYFRLNPGSYTIRVDSSQLLKLGMTSDPESLPFNIDVDIDGDIVDELNFTLHLQPIDTTALQDSVKLAVRKDTTYIINRKVIQKVEAPDTYSFALQLGAFRKKSNAEAFKKRLDAVLGKEVEIFIQNGFYKVRIANFETKKEASDYIPELERNGISKVLLLTSKGTHWVIISKQDTITQIISSTTLQPPLFPDDLKIQAGQFKDSVGAEAFRRKLIVAVDNPVVIDFEDGHYEVRIVGFNKPEEMEEIVSVLHKSGYNNIWVMPAKMLEEPVIKPAKEPEKVPLPVITIEPKTDSIPEEPEKEIEIQVPAGPAFSLQVAVFYKRSKALRAQRRITEKLKLPVEIVQQWEYYRVIVTGFYSPEETYKYYPELVGLGYQSISLIEKPIVE